MQQIPANSAVIEFGYLVSAEGQMSYPWKFFCFHCSRPMALVHAQGDAAAHFLHDLAELTDTAVCPNIVRPHAASAPQAKINVML